MPRSKSKDHDHTRIRYLIVLGACLWWLTLASLSRLNLSRLQLGWTAEVKILILVFLPLCVLAGLIGVWGGYCPKPRANKKHQVIYYVFWFFMILFAIQCVIYLPPAFSADPNEARLEWGFKYVHVLTEVVVRTTMLVCVGSAIARGRFRSIDRWIILASILYTLLVVSRSFLLEMVFYWVLAVYLISRNLTGRGSIRPKHALLFLSIFLIFIVYGNWRQGSDFSIVEYGEMLIDSNVLAWIFGYFLVNYDNLALLVMENFKNESTSNLFGSLIQTLQLGKFDFVDDYLYVGKFNLGTAIRSYVLDFGPWVGGLVFAVIWILVVASPSFCRSKGTQYAAILLIAYIGFCLPITGRMEQPPYLFSLVWVVVMGHFSLRRPKSKSRTINTIIQPFPTERYGCHPVR